MVVHAVAVTVTKATQVHGASNVMFVYMFCRNQKLLHSIPYHIIIDVLNEDLLNDINNIFKCCTKMYIYKLCYFVVIYLYKYRHFMIRVMRAICYHEAHCKVYVAKFYFFNYSWMDKFFFLIRMDT